MQAPLKGSCSPMGEKNPNLPSSGATTLLDLGDEVLLNILFHLHDAPAIVRFGAVNKRTHRLHFSASRIRATIKTRDPDACENISSIMAMLRRLHEPQAGAPIEIDLSRLGSARRRAKRSSLHDAPIHNHDLEASPGFTEAHLKSLLSAMAHKGGGLLQELRVSIDQHNLKRMFRTTEFARLDWIKLVSGSLQRLELRFYETQVAPGDLFSDLASCSNLVTLELFCGGWFVVTGENLDQLLAACSRLKKLFIADAFFTCERDSLKLASESLEDLCLLFEGPYLVEFCLQTPALGILQTDLDVGKLELRSRALRCLKMDSLSEFNSGTPLAKLEILCGFNWSFEALKQVMRRLTSVRLEKLVVSDKTLSIRKLPMILSRHLREVEKLHVWLQGRVPRVDAPVGEPSRVRVEEIGVIVSTIHLSESDQYDHLYNSVVLLRKSFPLVQRIVITNWIDFDEQHSEVIEATARALEDLKCEFPGLVSEGFK